MTTATLTHTLEEEYVERWPGDSRVGDVEEGLQAVHNQLVGAYYQTETGDYPPLANDWRELLEQVVTAAGAHAFDEHVVPAMAAAAAGFIRTNPPPEYLRVYPGSEQLRADLALLEGKDA